MNFSGCVESLSSLWIDIFGPVFGLSVVIYGDYSLMRIRTKVREVLGGGRLSPKSLVTDEPYGVVCHPMYSALFFVTLGLTVASPLFYNIVNLVLASVSIVLYTVLVEEPITLRIFGQHYARYTEKAHRRFLN
jgi:protein-S-isoprenylcysteine O-methyltransferase Ste14